MYKYMQFSDEVKIQEMILQSIRNKDTTLQLYNNLVEASPDLFCKSLLSRIYAYEGNLLNRFKDYYTTYFGPVPSYTVESLEVTFDSFAEGLIAALLHEANQVSFSSQAINLLTGSDLENDLYLNALYLYRNALSIDMEEQILLNAIFTHYLHFLASESNTATP